MFTSKRLNVNYR